MSSIIGETDKMIEFKFSEEKKKEMEKESIFSDITLKKITEHFLEYYDKLIFDDISDFNKYLDDIDNYDINKSGNFGFIHILIYKKYNFDFTDIINKIDINMPDKFGWTPIMILSKYTKSLTSYDLFLKFLNQPSIDLNKRNMNGFTAFLNIVYEPFEYEEKVAIKILESGNFEKSEELLELLYILNVKFDNMYDNLIGYFD
tara:strand:- start:45 stop:650 length:606 start_codon:yes stop_codon:yes gene_type:complete